MKAAALRAPKDRLSRLADLPYALSGLEGATRPERFAGFIILNTWLHRADCPYSDTLRCWRAAAIDPAHLGGDMTTGRTVAGSLRRESRDLDGVRLAYYAPFPDAEHKGGARRFPFGLPFAEPGLGRAALQEHDCRRLPQLSFPTHVMFGIADEEIVALFLARSSTST